MKKVLAGVALAAVSTICSIGKQRQPLTPGVVAVSTVFSALIIWGIIAVGIYG